MKKFEEKIKIMKEGGNILKNIFQELEEYIRPGIPTLEIDRKAGEIFRKYNVKSAFKGYKPDFAKRPFLRNICISLNEIIVHGIAKNNQIIKEGDLVKLDIGIIYKNFYLDAAKTIGVGKISEKAKLLIEATKKALINAIDIAREGNTLGDIGFAIKNTIESYNFKVIKNLCGHDIGEYLHGNLQILNFGEKGKGLKLKRGMIFTIEPMASFSSEYAVQINDFEFKTHDNSLSSHFEVTVAILKEGNLVLTEIL